MKVEIFLASIIKLYTDDTHIDIVVRDSTSSVILFDSIKLF